MGKRVVYTKITPLPSNVPRQLAIELLHSHEEVIKLNPLVTGSEKIDAPRDCPNDEYFSQWYEISEIITWGFGMKKKIKFKGVFHDLPYGMQSHVYAPMGVDLRNKYRIGGNQPGEPREARELGIDTPLDGLYLREDVEITCNFALASYVKKETIEATGIMISRMTRKAELLDEGKLHAMFEEGKLKTSKPTFGSFDGSLAAPSSSFGDSPPHSPVGSVMSGMQSPRLDKRGFGNYHDVARSASQSQSRNGSYVPGYQQAGYTGPERPNSSMPMINELPGDLYPPGTYPEPLKPNGGMSFRSELPGDSTFTPSQQPSPDPAAAEVKPPGQPVYQAYPPPPPPQNHPANRNSYGSSTYSTTTSSAPTPELTQRQISYGEQGGQRQSSYGQQGGLNPPQPWQQAVASSSQLSVGQASNAGSRPSTSPQPDHQRFSNLSVQPDHQRFSTLPSQQSQPPASPTNFSRPAVRSPPPPQLNPYASAQAKCPVCGLFEGDEAAVSHHVSKAHFS